MPIMARTRAQNYDPYDDWRVGADGRTVNALGQHKIVGYSPDRTPSRGFGGLNEHYARQNYGGTRQAIDNFANDARKAGELVGKDGGRMLDTWENRGYKTHLSNQNPYAAPVAPQGAPAVPILPPGAPSAENQRFANQPAPKGAVDEGVIVGEGDGPEVDGTGETGDEEGGDEEGGDGGGGGQQPQPEPTPEDTGLLKVEMPTPNRALTAPTPPPMGNDNSGAAAPWYQGITDSGWGQSAAEDAMQSKLSPQPTGNRVSTNPYMARASNVARAMADGSFEGIRDKYNRSNMERGYVMNGAGDIIENKDIQQGYKRSQLQPRADEIAAQRDFARGEAPVQYSDPNTGPNADEMNPAPIRAEKMNPYGTATATYGSTPPTGGTMKDPLTGNTVPIKQWTSQQSAVQDTKYGPGAAQAGEDYFNPKKIAASTVPLGQDDAEQYRAIARGGKIPRSSKA